MDTLSDLEVQVLISVINRAPMSLAEQLVCNHVVEQLVRQVTPPAPAQPEPAPAPEPPPSDDALLAALLQPV